MIIPGANPGPPERYPLVQAAQAGHVTEVTCLIEGASPFERNRALVRASWKGHLEVVEALLPHAEIHAEGHMALSWAVRGGYHAVVARLLFHHPVEFTHDVDAPVNRPLRWACHYHPDTTMVHRLLPNAEPCDVAGWLLAWAVCHDDMANMRKFLDEYPDVHVMYGLLCAVWDNRLEALHALLPRATEQEKYDAFCCAVSVGNVEVFHAIRQDLKTPLDTWPLYLASKNQHDAMVRALLPDSSEPSRRRAFLGAASYGHVQIMAIIEEWTHAQYGGEAAFLRAGLEAAAAMGRQDVIAEWLPKMTYRCQISALRAAVKNGHVNIVILFMEEGVLSGDDIDEILMLAVTNGEKDVVTLLLPHTSAKKHDSRLLCTAVEYGHTHLVDVLLPLSNPRAKNNQAVIGAARRGMAVVVDKLLPYAGVTARQQALLAAASEGHEDIVDKLLPHTSPGARNQAMGAAARAGHVTIVTKLLPHTRPHVRRQALTQAAHHGHASVVRILLDHDTYRRVDPLVVFNLARYNQDDLVRETMRLCSLPSAVKAWESVSQEDLAGSLACLLRCFPLTHWHLLWDLCQVHGVEAPETLRGWHQAACERAALDLFLPTATAPPAPRQRL